MIEIYNLKGEKLKSIPNDEFFNHVTAGELLTDHPEYDETRTDWSFVIFPHKWVDSLYSKLKKERVTPSIQAAYDQQLGLIEICQGDYANPMYIHMLPGLNVGLIKKEWYLLYCKHHEYVVKEIHGISYQATRENHQ